MENQKFKAILNQRMLVMEWWNLMKSDDRALLAKKYSEYLHGRPYDCLTGREIAHIHEKEKNDNPA